MELCVVYGIAYTENGISNEITCGVYDDLSKAIAAIFADTGFEDSEDAVQNGAEINWAELTFRFPETEITYPTKYTITVMKINTPLEWY